MVVLSIGSGFFCFCCVFTLADVAAQQNIVVCNKFLISILKDFIPHYSFYTFTLSSTGGMHESTLYNYIYRSHMHRIHIE